MSLKGKFRQKLYKEDLIPVIKQALFVAFVGGLLIGALNLLFVFLFSFSIVWMLCILMAYFLSKRIRQAYVEYHIVYSFISVIGFILGFYLLNVVSEAGLLFVFNVTNVESYLQLLNPLPYFWFLLPWQWLGSSSVLFKALINVLFFGIAIYYAYRYSK